MISRPHDMLVGDLGRHLRENGWLAFTEIQIRGTEDGTTRGSGVVDVVAVMPRHYAAKDLRAYEVKVDRADFQRDVGSDKWRRYRDVFHRVFFAVPKGLVTKAEVPDEAGLIVRGDNGWTVVKTARSHIPPNLNVDAVLALLFRGYEQDREIRNLRQRLVYEKGVVIDAHGFGWETRRRLAAKKKELAPSLQALKTVMETEIGESLDKAYDVDQLRRRLSKVFETLAAFDKDNTVMSAIARYLDSLSSHYGRVEHQEEMRLEVSQLLEAR